MRLRVTVAIPEPGPLSALHRLRFLLLERSPTDKRHPGLWEFPGGNPEKGESLEAAAKREAEEETRLALDDLKPLGTWDRDSETRTAFFLAAAVGSPHPSAEHSTFRWAKLDEIIRHDPAEPMGIDTIECAKRLSAPAPRSPRP